ncbi:DUF6747 family protein [Spongiivirga sp. MCCC 1A20706]|uniref:DUF6747 family protein n=1 Tax=Spongiivirga sp. MCCC 1A20706 TaxID=3160963 RepID=UPI0039774A92
METFLQLRNLYNQAFENLKNYQKVVFKAASSILLLIIAVSIVAIFYQLFTGYFTM